MRNQNIRPPIRPSSVDVFLSALPSTTCAPFVFEAPEFGLIKQLLDVGGGTGLMASLLKTYNPHLKITIFDRADNCEKALDLFRQTDQNEDLGAHAGSIHFDPFPSGFEAIQFSGIFETLGSVQINALLRKAFDALPRGGLLLIYGKIEESSHEQDARPPVFLPALAQYRELLHRRGFKLMACRRCPGKHMLLSAIK